MESEVMDMKRILLQFVAGKKPAENASSSMNAYYDGKNGENEVEGHHEGGNENEDMHKDGDEDEAADEDEDEIEDEDEADKDDEDEDEDEDE